VDSHLSQSDTLSLLKAGKLQGSKQLKLSCGLTEFPQEIFDLAESLEILDLTGNALSTLPRDLSRLKNLRILFCSSNQFTHIPEVLGECQNLNMIGFKANKIKHIPEAAIPTQHLRWFIVTDNALSRVPNALGHCAKLQKLMLAGNQLSELPDSMANCHNLELLRISANQFKSLPDWLFTLPKLSWLAYAGNPFCDQIEQDLLSKHQIRSIDWQELELLNELGQGASGVTYQALWHHSNQSSEIVAVKLFKGTLTSDGLPGCEVNANILAEEQANLVGIKGVICNHPQGTLGLVMPLLKTDLNVLANPPSFESCTRDIYSDGVKHSQLDILNIALGVASAVLHLHAQSMTHGDLYAHNILWNHQNVVLSDLGGASFLPLDNQELTRKLQRLESHAFGILLEELLNHGEMESNISVALWQLQKKCTSTELHLRPLFNEIVQKLSALK